MDGVLDNHFLTILKDNLCTASISAHVYACAIHNLDVLTVNPFFASVRTDNVNCSVHSSLYLIINYQFSIINYSISGISFIVPCTSEIRLISPSRSASTPFLASCLMRSGLTVFDSPSLSRHTLMLCSFALMWT